VDPFQTHYFSENLVAPGIGPGTSGSVARNSIFLRLIILIYYELCMLSPITFLPELWSFVTPRTQTNLHLLGGLIHSKEVTRLSTMTITQTHPDIHNVGRIPNHDCSIFWSALNFAAIGTGYQNSTGFSLTEVNCWARFWNLSYQHRFESGL
jgi:hypothetical protein